MIFLSILLILVLIYILSVLPNVTGKKKVLGLYAHRGLYSEDLSVPENTIEAFKAAIEKQVGIELDIQMSQDQIIYVFHDDHLRRLTNSDKKFSETPSEEIDQLSINGHSIPRFEEVLKLIQGKIPLIIEFKSQGKLNKTLCTKAMEQLEQYQGEYCVESFDPRILLWFKTNNPAIVRGQLVMSLRYYKNKIVGLMIATYLSNLWTKPDFMAIETHTSFKQISFSIFRKFKGNTVGWTIKKDLLSKIHQYDAIIFEHCDLDSLQ